jgi:xylose isomerase
MCLIMFPEVILKRFVSNWHDDTGEFKINVECNHATLSGHRLVSCLLESNHNIFCHHELHLKFGVHQLSS